MYSRWISLILLVVLFAPVALAEKPLAMVSSLGSVELGGSRISNIDKAPTPLSNGGEIATTTCPAVLRMLDRSIVTLDKNSRATLVADGGRASLHLLQGSASYRLASTSALQIFALDREVTSAANQGRVSIQNGTVSTSSLSSVALALKDPPPPAPTKPKQKSKSKDKRSGDVEIDKD